MQMSSSPVEEEVTTAALSPRAKPVDSAIATGAEPVAVEEEHSGAS